MPEALTVASTKATTCFCSNDTWYILIPDTSDNMTSVIDALKSIRDAFGASEGAGRSANTWTNGSSVSSDNDSSRCNVLLVILFLHCTTNICKSYDPEMGWSCNAWGSSSVKSILLLDVYVICDRMSSCKDTGFFSLSLPIRASLGRREIQQDWEYPRILMDWDGSEAPAFWMDWDLIAEDTMY